ncbi:MAG TPA: hypothetical protein VGD98_17120 [Ktedonobacteraceae bacterium]
MESLPEDHLQQSLDLAQQAAAQMKRAANLAEHAAQLWQKALALANQEELSQPPVLAQSAVSNSKRQRKQHIRPTTTLLIENAAFRKMEHLASPMSSTEQMLTAQPEATWDEGENWWKPRAPTETFEI